MKGANQSLDRTRAAHVSCQCGRTGPPASVSSGVRQNIMSFDLEVVSPAAFPDDLGARMVTELRKVGVEIDVYPNFTPSAWEGGFLPMKVLAIPAEYIGCALLYPALSGFEVSFDQRTAWFRSPAGRTTIEFALQCLCAAAVVKITGGHIVLSNGDITRSDQDPIQEAVRAAKDFAAESTESDRRQEVFERWLE